MEKIIESTGLTTEAQLPPWIHSAIWQVNCVDFNCGAGAGRSIQQHHVDHLTCTPYVQFLRCTAYDFDVIDLIR